MKKESKIAAHEVNFDGIVGPTHHYGGLSFGNLASTLNESHVSNPKAAALQGLTKMKALHDLGLKQGVLPPHPRPYLPALKRLGYRGNAQQMINQCFDDAPDLLSVLSSASNMWVANAATISPSCDTADGKVHITPANLAHKLHRAIEWPVTASIMKSIFKNDQYFVHHEALPCHIALGDEGAANHMRFSHDYQDRGIEVFVYGSNHQHPKRNPKKFPARQTLHASRRISKSHQLNPDHTMLIQQNPDVIDQGVFHNDVIAINNKNVLLCHENAWVNTSAVIKALNDKAHQLEMPLYTVIAKDDDFTVKDAVTSYVFNSQIISKNAHTGQNDPSMTIIAPIESKENPRVSRWLDKVIDDDNPITEVKFFDLKQSMQNGGGPACLRLRVVLTQEEYEAINQGVLLTEKLYQTLTDWVNQHYRDRLTLADLNDPNLWSESQRALTALKQILKLNYDD